MKKPSAEQLLASAWSAALLPNAVDKVPPDWLTCADLAEKLGKAKDTVSTQLTRAVREGRAEVKKFRILTARGAVPVPHYRLK